MAGKLVLHIGHYKTGTTALQVFLSRNAAALRAAGLDYPDLRRHNAKHSAYAFALLRAAGATSLMHGYTDPVPPELLWEQLFDRVRRQPRAVVAISSEEFMRLAMFPDAEARLAGILARHGRGVTLEAVAYLRAPQPHLRAWYNQLVKMCEPTPAYPRALEATIERIHLDYGFALAPWRRLLGDGAVVLRPYRSRSLDPRALFDDFLATLGIAPPEGLTLPEGDPNPRLDDRVVELLRLVQNAGIRGGQRNRLHRELVAQLNREAPGTVQDAAQDAAQDGLERPRRQAAAGLKLLAGLPRCGLDLGALAADLPREVASDRQVDMETLGFVLAELARLRRQVDKEELAALSRRLDRLEALLPPSAASGSGAPSVRKR